MSQVLSKFHSRTVFSRIVQTAAGRMLRILAKLESHLGMPKYYVQSGSFRGIVARENAQAAARWAVEFVMKQAGICDPEELERDVGLFRLGKTIGVSQRGFSRKDRVRIPTSQAVLEWMIAEHSNEKR